MRRLLKSKLFIVALVVVIILALAAVSAREGSGIRVIGNIISVPIAPLQSVISFMAEKIGGVFEYFRDVKVTKAENEELLRRITELEKENRELERLERENKELRDALNFLDQMESFEPIGCTIIAKDPGNWFEVFTINRGSKDGIEINSPVVTAYGLVGRVSQVDLFTSKVTSIIDMDSTVAARVSRSRDILIVRGDAALRNSGLCRMDYISPDVDIMPETSSKPQALGVFTRKESL